jgi:hypothetical protein
MGVSHVTCIPASYQTHKLLRHKVHPARRFARLTSHVSIYHYCPPFYPSILSFYPAILLSCYPSILLSFYPAILLLSCYYPGILLSFYPSVILLFYYSIILSFYHSIILSFYPSIPLSFYPSILSILSILSTFSFPLSLKAFCRQ